ncbi:hypothetical protein SSCG_03522 [Streptomyces clavuligerus]|nr:hypothetical protein SSCG_03522 [Streptomyces clavuligerus]
MDLPGEPDRGGTGGRHHPPPWEKDLRERYASRVAESVGHAHHGVW